MKMLKRLFALVCFVIIPMASFAIYSPNHSQMEKAFTKAFSQIEHAAELCSYQNLDQDIVNTVIDSIIIAEVSLKQIKPIAYKHTHSRINNVLKNIQKARFSIFVDQNMSEAEKVLRDSTKILDELFHNLSQTLVGNSLANTDSFLQELQTRTKIFQDNKTGLEWIKMSESGRAVSWNEAQEWIKSLGADWRTPTVKELDEIEKNGFHHNFIRTIEFVMWAEERNSGTAWIYTFGKGSVGYYGKGGSSRKTRAIAVRNIKPENK